MGVWGSALQLRIGPLGEALLGRWHLWACRGLRSVLEFESRVVSLGQGSCLDHRITQTFSLLTLRAGQAQCGGDRGFMCV